MSTYGANPNHSRFDHKHQNICTALDYAIINNDERSIEILSRYKAKTASNSRVKAA